MVVYKRYPRTMKISEVVSRAKRIAHDTHCGFAYAARVALTQSGFRAEIHTNQTLRVTRGLVDDVGLSESLTLYKAIVTALGREGARKHAEHTREQKATRTEEQLTFL